MAADVSLEKALSLFGSRNPDERTLGMNVLFRRYVNRKEIWDAFVKQIIDNPAPEIPRTLIHYLAHIPWHPDIAWTGREPISRETREYARQLLSRFGKPEVTKLLSFVDEETGLERGSIGQAVEAIILSLPQAKSILVSISEDCSAPLFTRECAAFILGTGGKQNEMSPSEDWRVQAQRILRGG